MTLVVDKVHSQHFLLAKNTEAIRAPLPDCIITLLPPPWKRRAWLSIRQPDSSCVCSLLYWASKTRPLSLLWTLSLIHRIYTGLRLATCHKALQIAFQLRAQRVMFLVVYYTAEHQIWFDGLMLCGLIETQAGRFTQLAWPDARDKRQLLLSIWRSGRCFISIMHHAIMICINQLRLKTKRQKNNLRTMRENCPMSYRLD